MKIVVSGASGLIGTQLVAKLSSSGHEVIRLVRRSPKAGEIHLLHQKILCLGINADFFQIEHVIGQLEARAVHAVDGGGVLHAVGFSVLDNNFTLKRELFAV